MFKWMCGLVAMVWLCLLVMGCGAAVSQQQLIYDQTKFVDDYATGNKLWNSGNVISIYENPFRYNPLSSLSLMLLHENQDVLALSATMKLYDRYYLDKAYANGQELFLKPIERWNGTCSSKSGLCTYFEYVIIEVPIEMAINASCHSGLVMAASGRGRVNFIVKKETLQGFLYKSKLYGADLEGVCFDSIET